MKSSKRSNNLCDDAGGVKEIRGQGSIMWKFPTTFKYASAPPPIVDECNIEGERNFWERWVAVGDVLGLANAVGGSRSIIRWMAGG